MYVIHLIVFISSDRPVMGLGTLQEDNIKMANTDKMLGCG